MTCPALPHNALTNPSTISIFVLGNVHGNLNYGERERERERERYKSFKDGKLRGKLGRWRGKVEIVASHSSVATLERGRGRETVRVGENDPTLFKIPETILWNLCVITHKNLIS